MGNDTYSGLLFKALFSKAAAKRIVGYGGFAFLVSGIADDMKETAIGTTAYIAYFEAMLMNARFMNRNRTADTQSGPTTP